LIEESIGLQIKARVFPEVWKSEFRVQSDVGMTRGQVDNDNNSQSQDLNILNNIHEWSLIRSQGTALVRDIGSVRGNTVLCPITLM